MKSLLGIDISIVGCGWLGLPLAIALKGHGATVLGSKTSLEGVKKVNNSGISCVQFSLDPSPSGTGYETLFKSEWLIVNIPPSRRDDVEEFHYNQMQNLIKLATKGRVKKIIFISSTSVYPNLNREVVELDDAEPEKSSGKVLKRVEKLFLDSKDFETAVLRFGGLIGGDRMPGRFLAGKTNLKNGEAPVNLIHLDDCIEIIKLIIVRNTLGEVFNACSPMHPKRKDFYCHAAIKGGFDSPVFANDLTENFKIINSKKLIDTLGYQFKYKNPLETL